MKRLVRSRRSGVLIRGLLLKCWATCLCVVSSMLPSGVLVFPLRISGPDWSTRLLLRKCSTRLVPVSLVLVMVAVRRVVWRKLVASVSFVVRAIISVTMKGCWVWAWVRVL